MQQCRPAKNNAPIEHELEYCRDDRRCRRGSLQGWRFIHYPDPNGEKMRYQPPESPQEAKASHRISGHAQRKPPH